MRKHISSILVFSKLACLEKSVLIWILLLVIKTTVWAFKSTWAWTRPVIIFRGFFGFFTVQSQISSWLLRSVATDCGLNDSIPLYKQIFRVAWWCSNWTVTSQQEGLELDSTPLSRCLESACSPSACLHLALWIFWFSSTVQSHAG